MDTEKGVWVCNISETIQPLVHVHTDYYNLCKSSVVTDKGWARDRQLTS